MNPTASNAPDAAASGLNVTRRYVLDRLAAVRVTLTLAVIE
jgi:hypothetical protein